MRTLLPLLLSGLLITGCQSQPEPAKPGTVIQDIAKTIKANYVDTETAAELSAYLLANEQQYEGLPEEAFISKVNEDLHKIRNDRHIQLISTTQSSSLPWNQQFIRNVQVLDGNVGYLSLSHFPNPSDEVYAKIAATFSLLKDTDGIIIDLRNNRGGHPEVVAEVLGYFTEGSELYDRFFVPSESKTYDYETHKKVEGEKVVGKPLSVLVNNKTASVSELFAFAAQNLKLGTTYGATSMGLVNLSGYYPIKDKYYLLLSKGKQTNPFDKNGLENIGVQPDVNTTSSLKDAHLDLVEKIHGSEMKKWVEQGLIKGNDALDLISKYQGKYGSIKIDLSDESLNYHDHAGFAYKMVPVSDGVFQLESSMEVRFRITFEKNDKGSTLVKKYFDGSEKRFERN
jgi:hypothetical protein